MFQKSLYFVIIPLIWAFSAYLVNGDTHEALVKRTSKGHPYYLQSTPLYDTLYDTVVPVVFEFKTPNWTKPIDLIGYTCTGDNYDIDGWSCPVLWYWLTQVRDILQEDIFVENLKVPDSSSFNQEFNCDGVHTVFQGLYLNEPARLAFYDFLTTNCQSDRTYRLPVSSKYIADNIDQPYKTMREKFFEEYYSLQTPVNRSNDAMYTNARYNFYSSGLFNYYVEAQRWKEASNLCKARHVPNTLISSSDLLEVLTEVQNSYATPNGYELTLPAKNISAYYKSSFEIADCAFTSDSLIVVVQIPLSLVTTLKKNSVELIPVPYFADPMHICYLEGKTDPERLIVMSDSSLEAVNKESDLLCNVGGSLCQVPSKAKASNKKSRWPQKRSCLQGLLEDDETVCELECENKKYFDLPMIKQISSDRVLIVGDSTATDRKSEVKVVCPLYQKEELIQFPLSGTIEVTLPCGCLIRNWKSVVLFKAESPCGSELHQIPIRLGVDRKNINSTPSA